jgi:hypothetical protein
MNGAERDTVVGSGSLVTLDPGATKREIARSFRVRSRLPLQQRVWCEPDFCKSVAQCHGTVKRMPLPRRIALPARQCSGDLAYRLLMLFVPDFGKVARDLELHTLVRHDLPRTFFLDTFVKIGDRRAQRAGDLK